MERREEVGRGFVQGRPAWPQAHCTRAPPHARACSPGRYEKSLLVLLRQVRVKEASSILMSMDWDF
jgi:hypothetical protein|eukprot:SAG25_NODE_337_length_9543_cov_4.171961_10_plen_66_part_00